MLAMCVKAGASSSTGRRAAPPTTSRRSAQDVARDAEGVRLELRRVGEPLVFDGVTTKPFEPRRARVARRPISRRRRRASSRYFQSDALRVARRDADVARQARRRRGRGLHAARATSMQPIFTPAMDAAYARGKSLASLFASLAEQAARPRPRRPRVVVDLPGPEAVAFAAGAAAVFDPGLPVRQLAPPARRRARAGDARGGGVLPAALRRGERKADAQAARRRCSCSIAGASRRTRTTRRSSTTATSRSCPTPGGRDARARREPRPLRACRRARTPQASSTTSTTSSSSTPPAAST